MPAMNLLLLACIGHLLNVAICELRMPWLAEYVVKETNFHTQAASSHRAGLIYLPPSRLDAGKELIHFVHHTTSTPHLMYLLYDDTYEEMAESLLKVSGEQEAFTVIKLSPNLNQIQFILSSETHPATTENQYVYVFCSIQNTEEIFRMIARNSLESRTVWWIILVPSHDAVVRLQEHIREGSQVLIFQMDASESFLLLKSEINRDGEVRFKKIGVLKWTGNGYKGQLQEEMFVGLERSYSNLNGRQLTATVNDNYPFMKLEDDKGDVIAKAGFELTIIRALSDALNFTFRITSPADGKWGGPLPNGTVVGLIGDVVYRKAHFALCEITITRIRESVIDFTYPYYLESGTMVSRSPREKNRAFAAFSPFSPESWLCIASAVVLIGLTVTIVSTTEAICSGTKRDVDTFGDSLFNMFRSLLKQDNLLPDHLWSLRFTYIFWYFFCLIISVLYSGMLIATLIKRSFEEPINGLVDLPAATKDGFTLVVTADTSFEYLFKDAKDGIYADTWKLFNHKDRSKSFFKKSITALETLVEEKQIILAGELFLKYHATTKGIDQYHFARDTYAPQLYGAACASGSPLLPIFGKMFLYMMEGGLISKWIDNEFQKVAGKGAGGAERAPEAFTIMHLQAAFYILCIGLLTATMGFLAEIITNVFFGQKHI